jgi:Zn ribbon nucleic-acid-binding protein
MVGHDPRSVDSTALASRRHDDGALQRTSSSVHMYLERAGRARERAHNATDEAERTFQQRMEWWWLNLAARTALVEGLDLFNHAQQHRRLPPISQCPDCRTLMTVRVIRADRDQLVYNFQCVSCGCQEQRSTAAWSKLRHVRPETETERRPHHPRHQRSTTKQPSAS